VLVAQFFSLFFYIQYIFRFFQQKSTGWGVFFRFLFKKAPKSGKNQSEKAILTKKAKRPPQPTKQP
jgi:polyferredoxin